jgi:hypothetical protein
MKEHDSPTKLHETYVSKSAGSFTIFSGSYIPTKLRENYVSKSPGSFTIFSGAYIAFCGTMIVAKKIQIKGD